ncbi:MAG: protein translocase subunit SecF [Candidatus Saccharimonadales bacterium]
MIDIISRRKLWYIISASILVPGLIILSIFGLRLGIDFLGGSVVEIETNLEQSEITNIIRDVGISEPQIVELGDLGYQVQFIEEIDTVESDLSSVEGVEVLSLNQVGPSVSRDLTINALWSLLIVSLAITIYIAFAFRKVEHPGRFGAIAIVALLHDALFVVGLFAVFGKIFNIEVDSFIVTAVLTVIGFSVHDTIVVFDRIRENLLRKSGDFGEIINGSINEVMGRSINTSITTILVLLALFLLGGSATSNFILALLLGMVAGTYSSIFIAAPLLVSWYNRAEGTAAKKPSKPTA